jgi:hypothetical protein
MGYVYVHIKNKQKNHTFKTILLKLQHVVVVVVLVRGIIGIASRNINEL